MKIPLKVNLGGLAAIGGKLAGLFKGLGRFGALFKKLSAPLAKLGGLLGKVPGVNKLLAKLPKRQAKDEIELEIEEWSEEEEDKYKSRLVAAGAALLLVLVVSSGLGFWYYNAQKMVSSQHDKIAMEMPVARERPRSVLAPPKEDSPGGGMGEGMGAGMAAAPGVGPGGVAGGAAPAGMAGAPGMPAPAAESEGEGAATAAPLPEGTIVVGAASASAFAKLPTAPPDKPLGPAPLPDLVETVGAGPLPKIAADGREPWKVYARPFNAGDDRPRIAVVVAGLGLSPTATEAAIVRLPAGVTLAFDSYGRGLDQWLPRARAAGHEVLVGLPMEPSNFPIADPGPNALMTSVGPEDNVRRLQAVLGRGSGYVGTLTVMGSQFATAENHLTPVLQELKKRGLMVVDGRSARDSKILAVAATVDMPRAMVDLTVEEQASRAQVDQRLAEAEAAVKKTGVAVVLVPPSPAAMERLAAWAAGLEAKQIALAPISAVANRQMGP